MSIQFSYHESYLRCSSDQTDSRFPFPIAWCSFHVCPRLHPPTETAFALCFLPHPQAVSPVSFHPGPGFIFYGCLDCPASLCFLIVCICILFTTRLPNAPGKMSTGIFLSWHRHSPFQCTRTHMLNTLFELTIFKPSLPGPSGVQAGFPLPNRNS